MQLGTQGVDAKISGTNSNPVQFKVQTNEVSFDILSKGLYGDPTRAVIRELSCNAWDAMVAAGKRNEPFEVHLPTQLKPIFSIKDYGTGLKFVKGGCPKCHGLGHIADVVCEDCNGTGDYDAVMRLMCTYFASNKTDSNEFIGALGLGSKSPFAYTNKRQQNGSATTGGFTITNRYEGKTRIYTACVKLGLPACIPMQVMDTPDAPNGVEISFPVDTRDIWEFENKAASVFEFFQPRPKLNKDITIHAATYSVKTEKWGMRTEAETVQGTGLRAIQGNVQYAVGNIDISRLTEAQRKMVSMPIDMFFPIGELSVAANRENLQLDDRTIANILKALDVVQAKLMEEVKRQIDAMPTEWQARFKIYELMNQPGMGGLVSDAYHKGMLDGKYSNFKLNGTKVHINELDYNNVTMVEFRHNDRARRKAKKENLFEHATPQRRTDALQDVAAGARKKSEFDVKFDVNNSTIIVLNDTKQSGDKWVNYLLQNDRGEFEKYRKVVFITRVSKFITIDKAMGDAMTILNKLGNPPSVLISALKAKYEPLIKAEREATPRVPREKMSVRQLMTYMPYMRRRSTSGWTKVWTKADDMEELSDSSITKFYLLLENGSDAGVSSGFYNVRSCVEFYAKVRECSEFGIGTIYGIKKGSKLLEDPSFVPVRPYVEAKLKSILTPAKQMAMSLSARPFSTEWSSILDYVVEHPQLLMHDSPIRQFALGLKAAKAQDRSNDSTLVQIAQQIGFKISNVADYSQAWGEVIKLYPMLKFCSRKSYSGGSIEEKTAVVDYIRVTDEQRRASQRFVLSNVQVVNDTEMETVNA